MLSGRSKIVLHPRVQALFLNLKDLRQMTCDNYSAKLEIAARSGFGLTFYRDGVVLVEKGKGDYEALQNLINRWPGCR